MAKSISDAIQEASDEELGVNDDETTDETTEETTSDDADEESTPSGSTLLDEEDEETDEDEESPDTTTRGDVTADETPEDAEADDIFDQLTAEELTAIKSDPVLNKLRKSLMKGWQSKTTEHSQLVQLGNAYRQDPVGVLRAMAQQLGLEVRAADVKPQAAAPEPSDPGKELEDLFGEQIGPKVRAVFDKWAEARFGQKLTAEVAPMRDALGRVTSAYEYARMQGEEASFKARHKDLTPQLEAAIVDLGNSGRILPGQMSPQEYLETLYDIASARLARQGQKQGQTQASKRLAQRIEANRRDREPSGVSGRSGNVKPVSKIPKARSISEALDFAMAELEAENR